MKIFKISNTSVKIIMIVILLLLFSIPLRLIDGLIFDREIHQGTAVSSIIEPLGGETIIEGIFVAFPYRKYEEKVDEKNNKIIEEKNSYIIFSPEKSNLDINIDTKYLTRGIFKVPVFSGKMQMDLVFDELNYISNDIDSNNINKKDALLLIGISNKKSFASTPILKANDKDLKISNEAYDFSNLFLNNLCYRLDNINLNEKIELKCDFDFQGGTSFNIIPSARDNKIHMKSNWKTPGFGGGFLPKERKINENGFEASWDIPGINTVYPKSWTYDIRYNPEALKIDFVQHINNYTRAERSIKYAFIFLLIPFLAMFVLEIASKRKVHPIQYILIGITNAIFYLLLISISEHLNFNLSYIICSFAVVITSFIYIISIFKSLKCGYILCGIQLLSYVFLYATLQSEDYALLIGSIGLFAIVVVFMITTRKIDWYNIGEADTIY